MRLGNGTGDATSVDRTRLRWFVVLLAMLLAIAGTIMLATPGHAEYEEEEEEFYCGEVEGEECDDFGFEDPFDGNWEAIFNCDGCDADFTVREPEGDDVADIEVVTDPVGAEFELKVIVDKGVGTSPGLARVDKDGTDMDRCRGNNDTDCVKTSRISGARTQYCVKVDVDPRFKFR